MSEAQDTDKLARARASALATYESIADMIARLKAADDDDAYEEMAESLARAAGYVVTEGMPDSWRWHKPNESVDPDDDSYATAEEAWLACCDDNDLRPDADSMRAEIQEDQLSIEVRTGWYTPGTEKPEAEEFYILLSTGGPAVRIVGSLGQYSEPDRARLECQDWFTPWTEVIDGVNHATLLEYCRQFYFGD